MQPLDVNGDGAVDIIASYTPANGTELLVWFENPLGTGGDPAVGPWVMHTIGSGTGEDNIVLSDLDRDGKVDIATGAFIFFQDGPDSGSRFNTTPPSVGRQASILVPVEARSILSLPRPTRLSPTTLSGLKTRWNMAATLERTPGLSTSSDLVTPAPAPVVAPTTTFLSTKPGPQW